MSIIIDGKAISNKILDNIQEEIIKTIGPNDILPCLTVITIGDDPASRVYVNNKKKACERVGLRFKNLIFAKTDVASTIIGALNQEIDDPDTAGIIIQQPIISDVLTATDKQDLVEAIPANKDVDGFGFMAQLGLYDNYNRHPEILFPCTPLGIVYLLKEALKNDSVKEILGDTLSGLNVLIIGRSHIVGKPLANMLLAENCTVTVAHSKTKNLLDICRLSTFDILITAVGKPNVITDDHFPFYGPKIIIDVGMNRDENGKLCGDISETNKQLIVGYSGAYTPVPGGVGPMTVAMLISNTWKSAKNILGLKGN